MSLELEKSMRIISDLVAFCYYEGGEEFSMRLHHHEDGATEMQVICPIKALEESRVAEVRHVLQLPRQHEVEQQYWELSGETEFSGELSLVGAMCDKAEVVYEGGVLCIAVQRND